MSEMLAQLDDVDRGMTGLEERQTRMKELLQNH